jgi:tricorn protease
VSQMLIERLRRELLATAFSRTMDTAATYPAVVFHGHLVCILNQDAGSDGDIFAAMFRQAGLGPLVGKRSWGGVVYVRSDRGPLVDGGTAYVPEFAFASADGRWIIEGHGVDPDIEVENDPKSVIKGRDPQLERAVEEVMKKVREQPRRLPDRPAPPIKTR